MANKKSRWPIFLILGIFWLSFLVFLLISLSGTDNRYIYPLDDTYIHIKIATNFSQHGVWGMTKDSFSSLSSSLLWSSLLSLTFFAFGANQLIPLLLTFILASLLLVYIFRQFNIRSLPPSSNFFGLLAIIFFTPLLPLVFTGLEHVLHALLTLFFINSAARALTTGSTGDYKVLLILGILMVSARYEGCFLIAGTVLLLLLKKRWLHSILLAVSGALPVVIFGLISLQQGWYFFPNSVLLKGNIPDISSVHSFFSWLAEPWKTAFTHPHIILLLLAALFTLIALWVKIRDLWQPVTSMVFLFSLGLIAHIQFAKLGWFYRYEAYLIIIGIFVLISAISEIWDLYRPHSKIQRIEVGIISVIIITALMVRGVTAHIEIPQACKNIYEQQYHIGLFLKNYYTGENIAANDIGAINFLADIQCLDLWGLNNMSVAQAKRENTYNTEFIRKITHNHHIKIAVLYHHWYDDFGGLPPEWTKVAEWSITDNVVCGDDTVTFYAVDPTAKKDLAFNLKQFSLTLPSDVGEKWLLSEQ